jgi:putative addiction module component (TIGR02574 family)
MSVTKRPELEDEVLSLPAEERARLAAKLLKSLETLSEEEIEEEWAREAERRAAEIDAGHVTPVPAEEVFRNVRGRLSK